MRAFLIAGEASGDRLGAALMAGMKTLRDDLAFEGVGGPLMQAEGFESRFPMDELSVMGLVEILPKYPQLKRRLNETVEAVLTSGADVLITIDSPDFCLRVARAVRARKRIRTVHYVAPSVWAWREKRARKMAPHVDQVLALLPFEPPFMQAAGMACDFVGHPVVSEWQPEAVEVADFRARHGLEGPLLMVLPGSRKGEVMRLAPIFAAVVRRVMAQRPDLRLVIPTTANVAEMVRGADWPIEPLLIAPDGADYKAEKARAFAAADWALAASGTVSLELAAAGTPMVIAYDVNWLSRMLIARMLKVDTLTLVNLVSETRAVPELFGRACTAEQITPVLLDLMQNPQAQDAAMARTMERLGRGGDAPGLRAARAVLKHFKPEEA